VAARAAIPVPPDDPTALASALVRFLDDREFARCPVSEGERFVWENVTVERAVEEIERFYRRILRES